MARLIVFNTISLDGYFVDARGDMSWAHGDEPDPEFDAFTATNARGGGVLVFGRVTYELMAGFWPTDNAARAFPEVARQMNALPKVVFSRTLTAATWQNTRLVKTDPVAEIMRLKHGSADMAIMGSGSIVSLLASHGLVDEYQFVVAPIVLGSGRTLFDGVKEKIVLRQGESRVFRNGNVFLTYTPREGD